MKKKIIIYGTTSCPFCLQAIEDYGKKAVFYDVNKNKDRLKEMLELSEGLEQVPVIVIDGKVTIGYGGA